MEGKLAELMEITEPKIHQKFVAKDNNGKKVLNVKLHKTLYGLLKSALIFYKKLLINLLSMGFQPNPYDPCVVNKEIDGLQMTITWHVDNL